MESIKLKIKGGRVEWRSKMVDKEKKESILDLSKYIDKMIRAKFQGSRVASVIL